MRTKKEGTHRQRCEAKYLHFVDEIVKYARANSGMTIARYSALMKVYAYCDMYGKACDLYECIHQHGLQPDGIIEDRRGRADRPLPADCRDCANP